MNEWHDSRSLGDEIEYVITSFAERQLPRLVSNYAKIKSIIGERGTCKTDRSDFWLVIVW